MANKYLINSIYRATEGEGIFLGAPQVFVRFQGCNIGCINCDSKDTWAFDEGQTLNFEQVVEEVKKESFDFKIKRISITGGDPLHPKHEESVLEIIKHFKAKGFFINLEAAGVRVVDKIFDSLDFISFDYKTPSTGVKTKVEHIVKLNNQYPKKFQVKAVIANRFDFDMTLKAYEEVISQVENKNFDWVLTPCYEPNEEFPMKRFMDVLTWNEEASGVFRVIGQQHKWVFGPDKKQV